MNHQELIELIEKQRAEIDILKSKLFKANKLSIASKYVINVSTFFLSDAICKLNKAMQEYDCD